MLAATAVDAAKKEHVAERFDVSATVLPDGSLEVVEEIWFRFTGGEYTEVTRELRATETDGVDVIEAAMDGLVLAEGSESGRVEIDENKSRARIVWHFDPTVDRMRAFRLRYRYKGVVRHGDGEDWFRWPPFPSRFDYPIVTGSVRLTWPDGAVIRRQPSIEGPIDSSSPLGNGVAVSVVNYRQRDDDVRVTVRFQPGAFTGAEPEWERAARRADRMAPAFIAGGVMILAATVLALWLFFLRFRRESPPGTPAVVTAPPDSLAPAIAGSISNGRVNVGFAQLLAVVFDLARRGVLRIEEKEAGGFLTRHKFTLRRESSGSVTPHEAAVLDALFKEGESEAQFDTALHRLGARATKVKRAVQQELQSERYIDSERKDGASAMAISGVVVIVLSVVFVVILAVLEMPFGPAALAVPGALMVAGLSMVITGASFSTLSAAGLRVAHQWGGYRRHLKSEFKQQRVPAEGEAIGRMLPYAAALGLLAPFGKALEKTDVRNLPAWLRTLDAAGGKAAMVAMIASSSRASSTHGGGAGTGGVGAGGSSSAR